MAAARVATASSQAAASARKEIKFFFDVACPYAYNASQRIEALADEYGATVAWVPVLLGGIYKLVEAPQGKDGSASDVMPAVKQKLMYWDLVRNAKRFDIPFEMNPRHPIRTLAAQRLLCSVDGEVRVALTHALYRAYWVDGLDLADVGVLQEVAAGVVGGELSVKAEIGRKAAKDMLARNTQEVVDAGGFGVPTMVVTGAKDIVFGSDRLHFVAAALQGGTVALPRRLSAPSTKSYRPKLTYYYDFSSPWSYIASTQVERIARECNADVEPVPILLGALFKAIGTPNVPMLAMIDRKRDYGALDMDRWVKWWDIPFTFQSHFPLRTVTALRVAIAEPAVREAVYNAAWADNLDIADEAVLADVLTAAGFDAEGLIGRASDPEIKAALRANTTRAIEAGCCGVPSFQVDGGDVIWGQDRLDVVADMLCGWDGDVEASHSRL